MDLPLQMLTGKGKGKENESPTVRLRVTWIGRQKKVADAGLPLQAPGKMFRRDITRIPLSSEEIDAVNICDIDLV